MKTQSHKPNLLRRRKNNNSIYKNSIIILDNKNRLWHTFVNHIKLLFKKLVVIIFDIRRESIPIAVVLGIFLLHAKENQCTNNL